MRHSNAGGDSSPAVATHSMRPGCVRATLTAALGSWLQPASTKQCWRSGFLCYCSKSGCSIAMTTCVHFKQVRCLPLLRHARQTKATCACAVTQQDLGGLQKQECVPERSTLSMDYGLTACSPSCSSGCATGDVWAIVGWSQDLTTLAERSNSVQVRGIGPRGPLSCVQFFQ